MSKYNLTDLLPEGTDAEYKASKEANRLKKHPEGDKIKAVQAMMAKEKSMKEDKYDDIVDADDDISADKKKAAAMAYRKVDKGDSYEKATSHMKENYQIDGEVYDRIDGLVDQPLLNRFLGIFTDIYDDFIEQGEEFEVDDVIDFLTICLNRHSKETKMEDQLPDGFNEGTSGPKHADGTLKSNDEMTDDEREDYYMNLDMNLDSVDEVAGDLDESKTLEDLAKRLGISVKDLEARVNKFQSAERGAIDTGTRLSVAEGDAFVDEGLKEHFQRFLKDYQ